MEVRTIVAEVFRSGQLTRHQQRTIDILMLRHTDPEDRVAVDQLTEALISGQVNLVEDGVPSAQDYS